MMHWKPPQVTFPCFTRFHVSPFKNRLWLSREIPVNVFILKPKRSRCRTDTCSKLRIWEPASERLVSLPVSQRWCWPWPARLLFQLALIVLCSSRKAAVNTDHNAVRVHTWERWSRQMWGFEPRDALQLKKRDEDYYEPI